LRTPFGVACGVGYRDDEAFAATGLEPRL
jgi:hypothetical protein